ncbi:uncharacterized protein LOC121389702 [Gigantopelta aegis]|uniref:uncharacterized protein LOC121389702 n=1 Tax=Gigantopelta aegis TaxID=1735272 RepID=UPI001B88BADF|nr:uncharacterized protein LOC121389702 [Gigantopelta aegis]
MIKEILTLWIVCLWALLSVKCLNVPPGCSYASDIFTCNYRFALPLDANLFDPKPQRLKIIEINGLISSADLINFDTMMVMTFNPLYAASLEIRCTQGGGGILTFTQTSFSGFGWVKEVMVVDCEFTHIPEGAFTNFGSLNSLRFEGGNIDNLHSGALKGMNLVKDFGAPVPKGEFIMINTKLVAGGIPVSLFANSGNVTSIKLCNTRIRVLQANVFSGLSKLAYLALSDNTFTYLKAGVFHSGLALVSIEMAHIDWLCSCSNLWFMRFADSNNIKLSGEIFCALPDEWKDKGICVNILELCMAVLVFLACLGLPGIMYFAVTNNTMLKRIDKTSNIRSYSMSTARSSESRFSIGTLNTIGIMTIHDLE